MADQNFTTQELESEEWRPVNQYPPYYVSNLGRVMRDGRVLKQRIHEGYRKMRLSLGQRKNIKERFVHYLVAITFLGPRPTGHVINHKDGQKHNNRLDNLEYVTPSRNFRHAVELGIMRRASGYYPIIKRLRDAGISDDLIQSAFQLSPRRMNIMKRRCR